LIIVIIVTDSIR